MNKRILYRDKWITIEEETELVRGRKVKVGRYIQPDAVVVLPVLDDGRFLMESQYRHAIKRQVLEFPGGMVQKGESPLSAARRELWEETGYVARHTRLMFWNYLSMLNTRRFYYFYATGLNKSRDIHLDDTEIIRLLKVRPEKLEATIVKGRAKNTTTALGYLYYRDYVAKGMIE